MLQLLAVAFHEVDVPFVFLTAIHLHLAAGEQKLAFSDCGSAEYNITSIDCETYVWPERTDAGYTSADDLKLTIEETDRTADHVTFSVTNHDSRTAYHVEAGAFGIDENRKFFGGDHKLLDKIRPDETVTFEFDSPVGILKSDTFITGFFDGLHFKQKSVAETTEFAPWFFYTSVWREG